jgi:hypothetical protein
MDNYETFSSNSRPQNSAMNVNEILSVFLLFFYQRPNSKNCSRNQSVWRTIYEFKR